MHGPDKSAGAFHNRRVTLTGNRAAESQFLSITSFVACGGLYDRLIIVSHVFVQYLEAQLTTHNLKNLDQRGEAVY
jgi:hypothetical protein